MFYSDYHVLWTVHWGAQVGFFDIKCHEFFVFCWTDAIEETLDCWQLWLFCSHFSWVVDYVTAKYYPLSFRFLFLGSTVAAEPWTCYFLAFWKFFCCNKMNLFVPFIPRCSPLISRPNVLAADFFHVFLVSSLETRWRDSIIFTVVRSIIVFMKSWKVDSLTFSTCMFFLLHLIGEFH